MGKLDRGDGRVCPNGVGSGHVHHSVNGVWKGSLQGNFVLDHGGGGRGSCLSQLYLEGMFRFVSRGMANGYF